MSFQLTVLVFLGAAAFSGVAIYWFFQALKDMSNAEGKDAVNTPLLKFVTFEKLLSIRFSAALALGFFIVFLFLTQGVVSPFVCVPMGFAGGFVGWRLPLIWFKLKIKKRREAFDEQILPLTMILANGLSSGQALQQALDAAAQRMANPMKEELYEVLKDVRLGIDFSVALQKLQARMPGEDLQLLVTSIRLAMKSGATLKEALNRMVEMIRARREFQEKLKTMTARGRFEAIAMSCAPLVVYLLLRLIDPELMKPLTSTPQGWCTLAVVGTMLTIGFLVINKVVSIEV